MILRTPSGRLPDMEVALDIRAQVGYQVTWGEVLNIALPVAWSYATTKVMDAALAWASERWRRGRKGAGRMRPTYVRIYGPGGETLREVRIDKPAGEPEDEDPVDR